MGEGVLAGRLAGDGGQAILAMGEEVDERLRCKVWAAAVVRYSGNQEPEVAGVVSVLRRLAAACGEEGSTLNGSWRPFGRGAKMGRPQGVSPSLERLARPGARSRGYWTTRTGKIKMAARQPWLCDANARNPLVAVLGSSMLKRTSGAADEWPCRRRRREGPAAARY